MKSIFIILMILIAYSYTSKAQNDTIWLDARWVETTRQNASFYRPPFEKDGNLYKMKDYYIDGSLQMTGTSQFKDSIHLVGKAVWYEQSGEIIQEENYKDNILDGIATYFSRNPIELSLEINYDNGKPVTAVHFDKNRKGIRYISHYENDRIVKSEYYGNDGEFIGSFHGYDENYNHDKRVNYYSNPMRVKSIEVYKDGFQLYFTSFYPNGQKQVTFDTTQLRSVYYDENGHKLGTMQYEGTIDQLYYLTGQIFEFDHYGVLTSSSTYKDGQKTAYNTFNTNGILVREEFLDEDEELVIVSYTEEGEKIGEYTEKNGELNGSIRTRDDAIITYKDNLVQTVWVPYKNSNTVFASLENSIFTFYDSAQHEMGKLKVKLFPGEFDFGRLDTYGYESFAVEGTLYDKDYKDRIISKRIFKDSMKISETTYEFYDDNRFMITNFYDENGYLIKVINYFSNGEIKSEIHYLKGDRFAKSKGTFYDNTGKKLSDYNYETLNGTLYEYFPQSDNVSTVQQMKNGTEVKRKKYEKFYDDDLQDYVFVLRELIDFNGDAKFYSKKGELIAEATFNQGKPTGTIYQIDEYDLSEFKNGQKHGKYIAYEYDEKTIREEGYYRNDKKDGTFTYSRMGIKEKEETYVNDKNEGYTIYYDENGQEISKLLYKDDEPYEGKRIDTYGTEVVYKEGQLAKKTVKNTNFKRETTYASAEESNTSIYSNEGARLLSFTEINNLLHGELIYYKNNKPDDTAVFEKGVLKEGAVWITTYGRHATEAYAQLSRKGNSVIFKTYNKGNELLFSATVNLDLYEDYKDTIVSYRLGTELSIGWQQLFIKEYGVEIF